MTEDELERQRANGRAAYRLRCERQKASKAEALKNSAELTQVKAELIKAKGKLAEVRTQMDAAWDEAERIKAKYKFVQLELNELKLEQSAERVHFEETLVECDQYKAELKAFECALKEKNAELNEARSKLEAAKAEAEELRSSILHGSRWATYNCINSPDETAALLGKYDYDYEGFIQFSRQTHDQFIHLFRTFFILCFCIGHRLTFFTLKCTDG